MRPPGTGAPQSYGSLQSQGSSSGPSSFNQSFPGPGPSIPGPAPGRPQAPAQPGKLHSLNVEPVLCSHCVGSWHCSKVFMFAAGILPGFMCHHAAGLRAPPQQAAGFSQPRGPPGQRPGMPGPPGQQPPEFAQPGSAMMRPPGAESCPLWAA